MDMLAITAIAEAARESRAWMRPSFPADVWRHAARLAQIEADRRTI